MLTPVIPIITVGMVLSETFVYVNIIENTSSNISVVTTEIEVPFSIFSKFLVKAFSSSIIVFSISYPPQKNIFTRIYSNKDVFMYVFYVWVK